MKKFVASFFFTLLFIISANHLLIFAWYLANQEAITEQFCVNKDKPELQCNGKCHLNDVLASNNKEDGSSSKFTISSEIFLLQFFQESSNTIFLVAYINSHFLSFEDVRSSQFTSAVFHPPPNVFFS
ncbi:MAG: hypothetical protein R2772_07690 [Chitinophagales bacterium]